LLVLPKEFTLQDVKQWNENVVKRRPDLASKLRATCMTLYFE